MLKPRTLRHFMLLSAFTLVASTKTMIAVDGQAQSHMRSLSAEDSHFARFEERFLDMVIEKVVLQLEKLSPTLHLRLASDKQKVINEFFEELSVKSAEGNLFASKRYQTWAGRVLGAYEDSAEAYEAMFRELNKHFDDYELALLIFDGRASLKTEAVAKEYYDLQMKDWIANQKELDVFRALKRNTGEGNVFKNPLLETFVSFVRQLPQNKSIGEQVVYSELFRMLKENFGVARLAEMLGALNVDLREDKVGGGVTNALFRDVASKERHRPFGYVLTVLSENAGAESSAVSIWLSYAKESLPPKRYKLLVKDVVKELWDQRRDNEKALANVITAAQEDESTREFATEELEKLFMCWRGEGKTASNVLYILGFERAEMKAEDIVESPILLTWLAFESRRHATDAESLMAMRENLSDEQLASMLVIKTRNPQMKDRLFNVRRALFDYWQTKSLDENAVFRRLRLDKAGDKLFAHPALNVWYWYVLEHHELEPDVIISRVVKKYFPNAELLLDMVHRELQRKEHSSARSIAKLLEQSGISPNS